MFELGTARCKVGRAKQGCQIRSAKGEVSSSVDAARFAGENERREMKRVEHVLRSPMERTWGDGGARFYAQA